MDGLKGSDAGGADGDCNACGESQAHQPKLTFSTGTVPLLSAGLGIPLATLDTQPKLDVAIDGADEVGMRGWQRWGVGGVG